MEVIKIQLEAETARMLRQRGFKAFKVDGVYWWIGEAGEAEAVRTACRQHQQAAVEQGGNK